MFSRYSARNALKLVPALRDPYNALTIMDGFPSSLLNSGPAHVYIFFVHSTVMYAFCMSTHLMSRLFNTAISNHILTESCDTIIMYVTDEGVVVI